MDEWRRPPTLGERGEVVHELVARYPIRRYQDRLRGRGVVRAPVQTSPASCLVNATPLLKKENRTLGLALLLDRVSPGGLHGPGAVAALAADDHPVNAGEVDAAEVFEERLDAQKAHHRWCSTQVLDARDAEVLVLDAHAPPYVPRACRVAKCRLEEVFEAVRAFREDLIGVPVRPQHDRGNRGDVLVGYGVLEEVAHAIDKDRLRCRPPQRFEQLLGNEPGVEAVLVWVAGDIAKAFRECFGVAVLAAGTDFLTTPDGIPGGLGPFDFGLQAHRALRRLPVGGRPKMRYTARPVGRIVSVASSSEMAFEEVVRIRTRKSDCVRPVAQRCAAGLPEGRCIIYIMRRTQLYLDDQLWGALHARARSEKTTVSELVRQAVRERYLGDLDRRRAAMQRFVGIRKANGGDLDACLEVRGLRQGSRLNRLGER